MFRLPLKRASLFLCVIAVSFGSLAAAGAVNGVCDVDCLQGIRASGNLAAQRAHVWSVFAEITKSRNLAPAFEQWHGEGAVFDRGRLGNHRPGLLGFARAPAGGTGSQNSLGVPVIAYSLFNDPAFGHVLSHKLNSREVLSRSAAASERDVPAFPSDSIIVKTVWWPVAHDRPTAMPVWDPAVNPARPEGNPYTTWRRVVAVDAAGMTASEPISIDFAGRKFVNVRRVDLETIYYVNVDEALAKSVMRDPEGRRAILIALGRPLEPGDRLALVGINMMSREIDNWIWAAFWWHDFPDDGPFAYARPENLKAPWSNYLMQAAFDSQTPASSDGGAHIAFNPWLEGRFPDGGNGGGTVSNCVACHRRASYPPVNFLPVTRGEPGVNDPAIGPERLRTSFLWSIAIHAQQ